MPENRFVIKNIFREDYYKQTNKDVQKKGVNPFQHYLSHGFKEGRRPSNIIEVNYLIKNRSLSTKTNIELDDLSDMLVDIRWSDLFSCHPLVCPSWIHLQLSDSESFCFVEKLSKELGVEKISLHPALKAISVKKGETLGDVISSLSEIDLNRLSLVNLDEYRIEHDDIEKAKLSDIQVLIHLWSTGIFKNRLKHFGTTVPMWASKECILKINCMMILKNEGKYRFYSGSSKINRIYTNRAQYIFDFDVHKEFLEFKATPTINNFEWDKVFQLYEAVCSGDIVEYVQRPNLSREPICLSKENRRKKLTDVELLSGSSGLPLSKRVCYTVNLNGYDDFPIPPDLDDCQYFLITDAVDLPQDDRWIIVRPTFVERDDKRLCLWYKTHPHLLFSWQPYSTWIDSNIQCLSQSEDILYAHEAISKVATFAHPDRTCVYEEAKILKKMKLDVPETIDEVVDRLKSSGMPPDFGLFETNVLFANLSDYLVREFFDEWWLRVSTGSRRDQMSFSPSAWATGVKISPLDGSGTSSAKDNKYFAKTPHMNAVGRKVV